MAGSLSTYWKKRDFGVTSEPRGEVARAAEDLGPDGLDVTSVATIMGALPIALGLGAGSLSRPPLGFAIVGGLLGLGWSTVVALFRTAWSYNLSQTAVVRELATPVARDFSRLRRRRNQP